MNYITAKTILTPVNYSSKWFGIDYTMNLYRGCNHGCIYCDSRRNIYNITDFDTVQIKKDAISILRNELRHNKKGIIGNGAMSDPYNILDEKYELTRKSLELIEKYNYGIFITTKNNLIIRDMDVLKRIKNKLISITITTPNDKLASIIEPNVSVSSKRFKAMKKLNENNIPCGIMLLPVLPFITDKTNDIKKLIKLAYKNHARFIYPSSMGMTLSENQRTYFYKKLDESFPNLKEKYRKIYNDNYTCTTRNYELYDVFKQKCDDYGILYKMIDIIKIYRKDTDKHSTFFK